MSYRKEEHYDDPADYQDSVGNRYEGNRIRKRRQAIEDGDVAEDEDDEKEAHMSKKARHEARKKRKKKGQTKQPSQHTRKGDIVPNILAMFKRSKKKD